MDKKAFYQLSSGLYLISSVMDGRDCGCVVNTVLQVTSQPAQLSVTINKDNFTAQGVAQSGKFAAVALGQQAGLDLIGAFGFQSSKDVDKFADLPAQRDEQGIAYVPTGGIARFSCKVVQQLDVGSHIIFVGQVEQAELLEAGEAMTYAYYQQIKKGGTPKNAPSYQEPAAQAGGYRCKICGYVLESETIPENFKCPICQQGPEQLEKL